MSLAVGLAMAAHPCNAPVQFLSPFSGSQVLEPPLGSRLALNCTAKHPLARESSCNDTLQWMKDGLLLERESERGPWVTINGYQKILSSILEINITGREDYGVFTCLVQNTTATFTLNRTEEAGHVEAVLFALVVLLLLLVGTLLYVKCRLNILLWYRDKYGDVEINDGKLYDAYVSYSSSTDDKKFAHFILKPHLENRYGYKLYLDDKNILPSSEPSAELIMNVSRCRRLIVVLSLAYLEQDWCSSNFREGLWRLMELSQKPIFIVFESQYKDLSFPVTQLLKQYKRTLALLLWKSGSMTPSSDFWKELCLAMPLRMLCRNKLADPQTRRQEDKDPMLIQSSSYLECPEDLDPEGDLGVRGTIYKSPPPRLTAFHIPLAADETSEGLHVGEHQSSEIDISDLGSRNYGARTDFYCLVTKDDM
ncbi:single Ig IL-1-related receptor isoform X1 [Rhinatrema bivittatum]|uniref:single Ig IL-1-related receptor isoform X1 n=1 Tax=Rhinatrema bivittatum TaxID=194408 RepID=UPI00112B6273|nr:single Ig IL-1-related receptor isoform X1 [Rhinatrema bivittatum]XP_029438542.1 single Ig IL-1-related receptor isoform X1 [Rhinatrema bivittatum]XP_029438544.1 single Ig IL-1-related receptor isoform X1 [Rhinatrema bivittatum]